MGHPGQEQEVFDLRHATAILSAMRSKVQYAYFLLPMVAVLLIPAGIIRFTGASASGWRDWQLYAALPAGLAGLWLTGWTYLLFATVGKGTCSPLAPPEKLLTVGPYSQIRNPMLAGAFLILLSETLLWQSQALAGWLFFCFIFHLFYWPLVEEPRLQTRFGREYEQYCRQVPSLFPRCRKRKPTPSNQ